MPRATGSLMRSHSTAGVPIPLSHPFSPPVPEGALLLTGATGFVGMEVLARLLERADRHVVALVRAEDDDAGRRPPARDARDARAATRTRTPTA